MSETPRCPNCGTERNNRYCPHCGQKDQPLRQSTWYFIRNAFTEYLGIDGRLWVTLRLLLVQPGRLTLEFVQGRRKRYLASLRLYLSATLLFFFLLSVLDPVGAVEERLGGTEADTTMTVAARLAQIEERLLEEEREVQVASALLNRERGRLDSLRSSGIAVDSAITADVLEQIEEATEELDDQRRDMTSRGARRLEWQREILQRFPPDSTIRPADLEDAAAIIFPGSGGLEINLFGDDGPRSSTLRRLTEARTPTERRAAVGDFARSAIDKLPIVMFFMLPVFALFLKVLYVRRNWYYSEHLIFALHNHAVAFFGFSLVAVVVAVFGAPAWVDVMNTLMVIGLAVYYLLAMKQVYGQGWGKTILKYLLLNSWYWFTILVFGVTLLLALAAVID